MNEEEKQAIEKFKNFIYTYQEVIEDEYSDYEEKESAKEYQEVSKKILKLIEKQERVIKTRSKEIESLYKMMSVKDDKIEKLKEDLKEERALNIEALKTLKECVHKDRIRKLLGE